MEQVPSTPVQCGKLLPQADLVPQGHYIQTCGSYNHGPKATIVHDFGVSKVWRLLWYFFMYIYIGPFPFPFKIYAILHP